MRGRRVSGVAAEAAGEAWRRERDLRAAQLQRSAGAAPREEASAEDSEEARSSEAAEAPAAAAAAWSGLAGLCAEAKETFAALDAPEPPPGREQALKLPGDETTLPAALARVTGERIRAWGALDLELDEHDDDSSVVRKMAPGEPLGEEGGEGGTGEGVRWRVAVRGRVPPWKGLAPVLRYAADGMTMAPLEVHFAGAAAGRGSDAAEAPEPDGPDAAPLEGELDGGRELTGRWWLREGSAGSFRGLLLRAAPQGVDALGEEVLRRSARAPAGTARQPLQSLNQLSMHFTLFASSQQSSWLTRRARARAAGGARPAAGRGVCAGPRLGRGLVRAARGARRRCMRRRRGPAGPLASGAARAAVGRSPGPLHARAACAAGRCQRRGAAPR